MAILNNQMVIPKYISSFRINPLPVACPFDRIHGGGAFQWDAGLVGSLLSGKVPGMSGTRVGMICGGFVKCCLVILIMGDI